MDTRIYFYNNEYQVSDFFTDEEVELGLPSKKDGELEYKPISEADIKSRLSKEIPVLQVGADLIHKTYKNTPNVLVVTIKAKKKGNCSQEKESKEGSFSTSIQKIPFSIVQEFLGIAKYFSDYYSTEVHGDIYFDTHEETFSLHIPTQHAHTFWVEPRESDEEILTRMMENRDEMKVMEIHSHHVMPAVPSDQDDESEVFPILYTIVGRINQFFPDISVRTYDMKNQQHIKINPFSVFENPLYTYPTNDSLDAVEVIS
ncbi:Mov34/MPN/PAD-1 family protein [Gracilibacillus sp. YIM 98692]|uniref:Mov34/MPN/PAD-1 family protein n=1 Tax=Gracilibacillus sp. YIM 98692 TaxID=2663532 RepID=UPI001F090A48|nr:Mov34/MPN/PAD-1 family protein [Gracilibacillus sp. YIM 98692]